MNKILSIDFNKRNYAIVIKNNFKLNNGIKFFTDDTYSQQLGYMQRPKNYVIPPHYHNIQKRKITNTQEVLFIKKGKVKVYFYDIKTFLNFKNIILKTGDVILLSQGGHAFKMLAPTEIIEVKQGPYKDKDKTFINLNIK